MSQYHCPACSEEYYGHEYTPAWSVGKVYCQRHKKYDPALKGFFEAIENARKANADKA